MDVKFLPVLIDFLVNSESKNKLLLILSDFNQSLQQEKMKKFETSFLIMYYDEEKFYYIC